MPEWIFVVAMILGAIVGSLVTAVWFLDHQPGEKRRKWWHDV